MSIRVNEFVITENTLAEMLNSNWCDYKSSTTPIIIRHHGRNLKAASSFEMLKDYPNVVMLAKDPKCAQEVLNAYPEVKWAKEYYTEGVLRNTLLGALQYCRDNGYKTCVLLDDDLRDFTVSFYGNDGKMHLSSQKYFPHPNPELTKRILSYSVRRAEALFKKHPDVGMVGWHHRAFGYLYKNCNTVDVNGGYNDYANGYIYNVEAIDRFGFELPEEYDVHGENVGVYCGMLALGMEMACLTGACISPNNDGDLSTLRTAEDVNAKNDADWEKVNKLTPSIVGGLRRQKTGGQYIKLNWKAMRGITGKELSQERLFYNPDDPLVNTV